MQKKGPGIVFGVFQSLASVTLGFAIASLGKTTAAKEGIFFVSGMVFLTIGLIVFYKYDLGNRINPAITNPKVRSVLTRYPLLPVVVSMIAGIIVMFISLRVLNAM